jgi:hypothetical protein
MLPAFYTVTTDLLARQAHHEAGHVIVAVHERFGLHYAKLGDHPVCLTNAALNRAWPSAVAEARFLVAGYAADRHFAPSVAARENFENQHDFARALELVDEDHVQILLREAERVIISRWPQVEAVAAALLDREFVSASEIYRVIVKAR